MSLTEFFHVGIVVPDIEAGRARFNELLGVEWGPVMRNDLEVRDAEGNELVVPNVVCYSTSAPYIELVEETPGTPWVCNEHSNIHHIGFFTEQLTADSGQFNASSCPLELMDGRGEGPPWVFAYHRDPLGVRLELVNAEMRSMMEAHMFRTPDISG